MNFNTRKLDSDLRGFPSTTVGMLQQLVHLEGNKTVLNSFL